MIELMNVEIILPKIRDMNKKIALYRVYSASTLSPRGPRDVALMAARPQAPRLALSAARQTSYASLSPYYHRAYSTLAR